MKSHGSSTRLPFTDALLLVGTLMIALGFYLQLEPAPQPPAESVPATPAQAIAPTPPTPKVAKPSLDRETYCLALATYHEARGESTYGQKAVAQAVLNRKASRFFPKTVCGVIFQLAQFSHIRQTQERKPELRDPQTWQRIVKAVEQVKRMNEKGRRLHYATHFYNPETAVPYNWMDRAKQSFDAGNHRFVVLASRDI